MDDMPQMHAPGDVKSLRENLFVAVVGTSVRRTRGRAECLQKAQQFQELEEHERFDEG